MDVKQLKKKITFIKAFKGMLLINIVLYITGSILFLYLEVIPLVILNVISIIIYSIILSKNIEDNMTKYTAILYSVVFINAILTVYFIGWSGAFYVYPLSFLPIVYFTTMNIMKKDKIGHIIAGVTLINYQISKIYTEFVVAPYENNVIEFENILYPINTFIASSMFIWLVYAFLCEMKNIQIDLENKNILLKDIANIDPLTKLNNRRYMNEILQIEIEKETIFCLAIGDIDDFKRINDTYGHDAGDIVLIEIANTLIENTKIYNISICRWGGEEFFILLKGIYKKEAKEICEKLLKDIKDINVYYMDSIINITITFGCAEFTLKEDIEVTIKKADLNLYKGKNATKNCVVI